MTILFEVVHPAHVHLFKNFIRYLKAQGHHVLVASREKDVTNTLLTHYNIEFVSLSSASKSLPAKCFELLQRDIKMYRLYKKDHVQVAFGSAESIAHLSALTKIPAYHFDEDDDAIVPLSAAISYPFFTKMIHPECLQYTKWRKKRVFHRSYHELAYLHPHNFTFDRTILAKYQLSAHNYVLVRLSALQAHHDVKARGISPDFLAAIEEVLKGTLVIKSYEKMRSHAIDPWDMHHVLAGAKMVISDSQTMTAEASVLGVPAIRYNSFVGRISYLEELEHQYGLTYGFLPGKEHEMLQKIMQLVPMNNLREVWQAKRRIMLAEKSDLTQWMIHFFTLFEQGGRRYG